MTLENFSPPFALFLLGILSLLLLWTKPKRSKLPVAQCRVQPTRLQLVDLKALADQRLRHLSNAQITLLRCEVAPEVDLPGKDLATRQMEGCWFRFYLRIEPPDQKLWWPAGITVECPEFLAIRDALPALEVPTDPEHAVRHVLHLRLQCKVEGDFQVNREIKLLAYIPKQCQQLEIGYYGYPLLKFSAASLV